jgi:hypothetical protein
LLPIFGVLIGEEEVGATEPLATVCVLPGIGLLALCATMPESTDRVFETRSPDVAAEEVELGEFLLSVDAIAALFPGASLRVNEVKLFSILLLRNATRGSSTGLTAEAGASMEGWATGSPLVLAMAFVSGVGGVGGLAGFSCFLASADFEPTSARAS